jgi:hypothetical protein
MKGKQVDLQTHGSPIGCHLLWFLHMGETEMVVMTEERMMVGMAVIVTTFRFTLPLFLLLNLYLCNFLDFRT